MKEANDQFCSLDDKIGYWEGEYQFGKGAFSRCTLLKLNDSTFVVYSPGPTLFESAKSLGLNNQTKIFILAPNSFHNIGIKPWLEAFPNSAVVSSVPAQKRLSKVTQVKIESLDELLTLLPDHIKLWPIPHSKLGETFITVRASSSTDLIVSDAFFNFQSLPKKGLMRWMMQMNRMGPGLEISRVYCLMGFSKKVGFDHWLLTEVQKEKPNRLVPLHGKYYEDMNLMTTLAELARKRLGL